MVWTSAVEALLANYVHDLSPVIVDFTETIKLRWYGLSYVAGFMVAYWILLRLSRREFWVVAEEKVSDVVTYTAVFGVFIGGRTLAISVGPSSRVVNWLATCPERAHGMD